MATLSLIGCATVGYKIWAAVVCALFVVLGKTSWKWDLCSGTNKTLHPAATSRPLEPRLPTQPLPRPAGLSGSSTDQLPGLRGRGAPAPSPSPAHDSPLPPASALPTKGPKAALGTGPPEKWGKRAPNHVTSKSSLPHGDAGGRARAGNQAQPI